MSAKHLKDFHKTQHVTMDIRTIFQGHVEHYTTREPYKMPIKISKYKESPATAVNRQNIASFMIVIRYSKSHITKLVYDPTSSVKRGQHIAMVLLMISQLC
jgi:hypothetical protein